MKIVLDIESKVTRFKTVIQMNQSLTIGRNDNASIRIEDERISGIHALIEFNHEGLTIFDKNSKNGLYINGLKIEQSKIYVKDKIKIGNTNISINDNESDKEAVSLLTYSGVSGTRMTKELQLGNAEVKIETPKANKLVKEILDGNKPRKRVTKEKLKQIYPNRFKIAHFIDLILLFLLALIPFIIVREFKNAKIHFPIPDKTLIIILECLLIPTLIIRNKKKDFTFGEQIMGLPLLYDKEND